jgi:predicted XRE-type DNA-binding protein
MTKNKEYEVTTGNVLADLGLPESEDLAARAELLRNVEYLIKSSGLSQKEISAKLGISQPKVSLLISGKLSAFSSDTLFKYLVILGCDVKIHIKRPSARTGIFRHRGSMAVC